VERPPAASSSTTETKVKGKVTRKGKPLAKAEIRFNPANVNRNTAPIATATTNADRSYEVRTFIGENTVTFSDASPASRTNPPRTCVHRID
jgi:hypothetical protein